MEPNNFKNKFDKDYKAFTPSDHVWESIDNTLSNKYRKKRVLALLLIIAFISIVGTGLLYVNQNSFQGNQIQQTNSHQKIEKEKSKKDLNTEKTSFSTIRKNEEPRFSKNNFKDSSDEEITSFTSKTKSKTISLNTEKTHKNNLKNNLKDISILILPYPNDSLSLSLNLQLAKHLYDKKDHETFQNNKKEHKITWSIKPVVGTNILNSSNKNHSLFSSNSNLKTNLNFGYTYGLNLGVKVSRNLWISTGLHITNYNYEIKNIAITTNQTPSLIGYISTHSNKIIQQSTIDEFNDYNDKIGLAYKVNYYEVPLAASYKFMNTSKLNLYINGGANFYYLNKNQLYLVNQQDNKKQAGGLDIFSKKHYSIQTGLMGNYPITKKLSVELGGLFKYHFDVQSKPYSINTYSIGINLGLKYQFKY